MKQCRQTGVSFSRHTVWWWWWRRELFYEAFNSHDWSGLDDAQADAARRLAVAVSQSGGGAWQFSQAGQAQEQQQQRHAAAAVA